MNKIFDYAPIGLSKLSVIADILESERSPESKITIINVIFSKEDIKEMREAMK